MPTLSSSSGHHNFPTAISSPIIVSLHVYATDQSIKVFHVPSVFYENGATSIFPLGCVQSEYPSVEANNEVKAHLLICNHCMSSEEQRVSDSYWYSPTGYSVVQHGLAVRKQKVMLCKRASLCFCFEFLT
jgi:hypothetical protein